MISSFGIDLEQLLFFVKIWKIFPGAWLNDLSIANCKGKLISPTGEKKIKNFQKKSIWQIFKFVYMDQDKSI